MKALILSFVALCLLIWGCGQDVSNEKIGARAPQSAPPLLESMAGEDAAADQAISHNNVVNAVLANNTAVAAVQRMIVHTAVLELVVEDFSGVPRRITELRDRFSGFTADAQLSGETGAPRSATWKLRIPGDKLDGFLDEARGLGELTSERLSSEDVTRKYYDLEARLRNKRAEEAQFQKILAEKAETVADINTLTKELSRVREEIERMESELRVTAELAALATVTITVYEIKDFVPEEAPTFATQVRRTWQQTLAGLRSFGQGLVLAGVFLGPWLAIFSVPVLLGVWIIRRQRRRSRPPIAPQIISP